MLLDGEIKLSKRKIDAILNDGRKSAEAVNLIYVDDRQPGIQRIRSADGFTYVSGHKKIRDRATLERIKKLVIPPAWENVWICLEENGHLQVTGIDARGRKQYKYHPHWTALRNHTKFYRLLQFGQQIPAIRQHLEKDLARPGMPVEKVLAAVVSLMDQTSIRIGNSAYEKLYGSFGLTTLKNQHVKIEKDRLHFIFKGKKGVAHKVTLKNKRLARIVKNCRDIPGKELFQYYDEDSNPKGIDSGMVNAYLKDITGEDFTAKDFRTWAGTVHAFTALRDIGICDTQTQLKKNVVAALDMVASHLGNTRSVCKKYYVHPSILELYEERRLHPYWEKCTGDDCPKGFYQEEYLVLSLLQRECR